MPRYELDVSIDFPPASLEALRCVLTLTLPLPLILTPTLPLPLPLPLTPTLPLPLPLPLTPTLPLAPTLTRRCAACTTPTT
jgi:hypothetical protein